MVGGDIVIRFSLVHSCKLVATRPQSEARLVSVEFWACFSLLTLVILDPSEEVFSWIMEPLFT